MSARETEAKLAAEIERIKEQAIEHKARALRSLAALLIAGVVVGVTVWFVQRPRDRDDAHLSLALGSGLAVFCLGCITARFVFPRPSAECPQCGCDWNLESENDQDRWLAWHCCPSCGLKMCPDTVSLEKQ